MQFDWLAIGSFEKNKNNNRLFYYKKMPLCFQKRCHLSISFVYF